MNKKLIGGLTAAAVLAFSACSSDDTESDTTTAATDPADTAAATTEPLATDAATTVPATTEVGSTEPATTVGDTDVATVLDVSFGAEGVQSAAQSDSAHDRFINVVEGADGLIYASGFTSVGDDHLMSVSRFNADGTADTTFGEAGVASVNVAEGGGGAEVARGIVVLDDGSVVVAGPAEADPAADSDTVDLNVSVVKFDAAGVLDATFGTDGVATFDLGVGKVVDAETFITDNAWGLTARDGGYALLAVTPNQAADRTDNDYAIVGITDAGALDDTFGTSGTVIVDIDASDDSARNIATTDDGSILATGYSRDGDGIVSPVLIKVDSAGVLDEAFGEGGVANHIVLDGVAESYNWASQGDNFILAGYGRGADSEEKVDLVVYRFLADGTWDETFGTDGVTRVDLAGEDDRARNVVVLPDGNILAVGSGKLDADNIDAMVVLLDPDGAPVESFGDGGHYLVDLGGPADAFFGATVTADQSAVILSGFQGADPDGTENDNSVLAKIAL